MEIGDVLVKVSDNISDPVTVAEGSLKCISTMSCLVGRLLVSGRSRYLHVPALPQASYPVIECIWLNIVCYTPLVIGYTTDPAFHDQAVLLVSGDSFCSHFVASIMMLES